MSPRTYYQILQVDSEASLEVIDAAYRRLARMYHPDVNSAPDALTRMQEVNQAYDVLKQAAKRSTYDAQLASADAERALAEALYGRQRPRSPDPQGQSRQTTTKPAPGYGQSTQAVRALWDNYTEPQIQMRCQKCGNSDSSLRIAAFPYVVSLLIVTSRQATTGLYCHRCRVSEMNSAKMKTALFGWWGIPWGPIYTLGALFTPADGNVPPDVNGPYLGALGLRFLQAGRIDEGIAALQASLGYQHNREVADLLSAAKQHQNSSNTYSRSTAEPYPAWRGSGKAAAVPESTHGGFPWKWAIVALLILVTLFGRCGSRNSPTAYRGASPAVGRSAAAESGPTRAAVAQPPPPPTARPVPTVVLPTAIILNNFKLRSGPGNTYAASIDVKKGQVLPVVAQQGECDWLQVETSHGEQGWVRNDRNRVKWDAQCEPIPLGVFKPRTQILARSRALNTYGTLKVENGTNRDAVVVLTDDGAHLLASAYIRAGDTYQITRIPDGSHRLYFTSGSDWDGSRFTSAAAYSKFDDSIPYSTTPDSVTRWSITLQPVVGGNAETTDIAENSFPAIE